MTLCLIKKTVNFEKTVFERTQKFRIKVECSNNSSKSSKGKFIIEKNKEN